MSAIPHDQMANAIRFLSIDAVEAANSGHPGLPMGAADIATVLFTKHMKFDPHHPDWADRDRFVLSAGHGSMLLYSALYLLGYEDITLDEIKNFRQVGAKTAGHPEYGHAAGIETTTGPLGQGIATAVGMALAEAVLNAEYGDDIVDHHTFVIASDGDLMEGISHEAIAFAGNLGLRKLVVIWDDNGISIDGKVSLSDTTDQPQRFEACGWHTISIDGHDPDAIDAALKEAKEADRPTLIAAKTTIGYGSPNKADSSKAHGSPLGADETQATRDALGWEHPAFDIPSDIRDAWRVAGLRSSQRRKEWNDRLENIDVARRAEFERRMRGDLPAGLDTAIHTYKEELARDKPKLATRKSSENALSVINAAVGETLGGSADLTGSNNTLTGNMVAVAPDAFEGRYVHYGIREHGMAAAMNGVAVHGGLIPYGGTFLTFSDYARGAMRLSALMGVRVIYVMTHDSIGLGEDGPTHQPVEHLAALRAVPNMLVMRPADATEVAECWQLALESDHAPSVLVLTRQGLPALRDEATEDNLCSRGAYEIGPAVDAAVTIFATGSEVSIAMDAKTQLEENGHATRVVSVPCWELFEQQSDEYKAAMIGDSPVKAAIEAAVRMGWDRFIGPDGVFIGMHGFGASGKGEELFEHFGITANDLVGAIEARLHADDPA